MKIFYPIKSNNIVSIKNFEYLIPSWTESLFGLRGEGGGVKGSRVE